MFKTCWRSVNGAVYTAPERPVLTAWPEKGGVTGSGVQAVHPTRSPTKLRDLETPLVIEIGVI